MATAITFNGVPPKRMNNDIAFLDNHERLTAHEFMHFDIFGYEERSKLHHSFDISGL